MVTSDHISDSTLIAASIDDGELFATIFDRHIQAVYRFAASRSDRRGAEDVASEAFTIAFANRHKFRPSASARPWLIGIAINVMRKRRDHGHLAKRTLEKFCIGEIAYSQDPLTLIEQTETEASTRAQVAEALLSLADRDREALLLFTWDDLSYEDIAECLSVPLGTVRSRIHRARAHVREAVIEIQRKADHKRFSVDPSGVRR
ncbi:MAG: sigma-70 family RNA polymerase sigma factor [Kineosporiaceae bacterium]|nr:sigma-70 family RNA polymerase sigma factor [Aeromicrobium sp.]